MKNGIKIFLFVVILSVTLSGVEVRAQNKTTVSASDEIDSLKLALKNANHDTTRCKILINLGEILYLNKPETALKIWEDAKIIAENNLTKLRKQESLYLVYLKFLADLTTNIGSIYDNKGSLVKAIEFYSEGLKLYVILNDKASEGICLNNIGRFYESQRDFDKAIEYYEKSIDLKRIAGDKVGVANSLNNIAFVYHKLGSAAKSFEYLDKALKLRIEIGDKYGIANSYNNYGVIYQKIPDLKNALLYFEKCNLILEEVGNKQACATVQGNIGYLYFQKGNYKTSLAWYEKGMKLAKETASIELMRNFSQFFYITYKKIGDHKNALANYDFYIRMRDSISNEQTKKASIKSQLKYEYEKRAAADSVKNAEQQKVKDAQLQAQNAQIKNEKFQRYALIGGLAIVILGLGFVINRFRITQKQKKIIEEQKIIVDEAFNKLAEKNKEVLDSIHYAKRIQTALITSEKYIERKINLLKSF